MPTRTANEALLRRNAEACEHAKHPHCTCQCGGTLHSKPHSEEWIRKVADETYERQFKYLKPEAAKQLRLELE